MIIDRIQADVDEAIKIRNEKVKTFQALTESEITTLERGTMTINTLNRIEEKQSELKNLLNELGYWNTANVKCKTNWTYTDIFRDEDFQRIIDNENILRKAFFGYTDTPETPDISYHYEDINSLEKILVDLDVMINDVKSNYRECGNYNCGED